MNKPSDFATSSLSAFFDDGCINAEQLNEYVRRLREERDQLKDEADTLRVQLKAIDDQEPVAFCYPWDLEKLRTNECFINAFSIPVGCPEGESTVRLYDQKPIIHAWPNIPYRDLVEHNRKLMDEIAEQKRFLDIVWKEFNIGEFARTPSVLETNLQNVKRFADYLHSVEREFFMVPGEPDEDYPNDEPEDVCLVNCWGSSKDEYIEQFRLAISRAHNDELESLRAQIKEAQEQEPVAYCVFSESGNIRVWWSNDESSRQERATEWAKANGLPLTNLYANPVQAVLPEIRNVIKIDRSGDQSINLLFASCRSASAFEKALTNMKSIAANDPQAPCRVVFGHDDFVPVELLLKPGLTEEDINEWKRQNGKPVDDDVWSDNPSEYPES